MDLNDRLNEMARQLADQIISVVTRTPINELIGIVGAQAPAATPRKRGRPRKVQPVAEATEINAAQMAVVLEPPPNPVTGRRRIKRPAKK